MLDSEVHAEAGPLKGTVKGPLAIIVVVLMAGFGLLAWQIDKSNVAAAAARDTLTTARAVAKGEHDTILFGQQAIVRAQEDNTCMLALPPDVRPSAVAWTRTIGNEKYRTVCEYVVTVYLAPPVPPRRP